MDATATVAATTAISLLLLLIKVNICEVPTGSYWYSDKNKKKQTCSIRNVSMEPQARQLWFGSRPCLLTRHWSETSPLPTRFDQKYLGFFWDFGVIHSSRVRNYPKHSQIQDTLGGSAARDLTQAACGHGAYGPEIFMIPGQTPPFSSNDEVTAIIAIGIWKIHHLSPCMSYWVHGDYPIKKGCDQHLHTSKLGLNFMTSGAQSRCRNSPPQSKRGSFVKKPISLSNHYFQY